MEVNGATLEYVAQGEGQPVVFVHGSISDLRVWNAQREAVAAEFEFIAYTRRYFGEQPWPDEGEDFGDATQAADLAAFVQRLGRGPVHMVTHSGGGGVGTLAALQRPDLFRSIVHFEPGGATSQLLTTDEGRAANEARQKTKRLPTPPLRQEIWNRPLSCSWTPPSIDPAPSFSCQRRRSPHTSPTPGRSRSPAASGLARLCDADGARHPHHPHRRRPDDALLSTHL